MRKDLIQKIAALGLCTILLSVTGCTSSNNANSNGQLEDMELVVTAQQGRVQNLEKQVAELEGLVQDLQEQVNDMGEMTGSDGVDPAVLIGIENENRKLVRLVFQSFTGDISSDSLTGLIETYDNAYRMNGSLDEETELLWITDGGPSGELYALNKENGSLENLGVFKDVTMTVWSPDNDHVIIETAIEKKHKGYLMDVSETMNLASMEYSGLPIWSRDGSFFVYLNENPNVLYTGIETAQMYSTGVFIYNMETGQFSTIDTGGIDYLCQDLSVDKKGEIKYVRVFKDGTQTFSSVTFN